MVTAVGFVLPATTLIFLPLSLPLGISVGLILWFGSVLILWIFSPVIIVKDGILRVGTAFLEAHYIAGAEAFSGVEARMARGPGADGRAWLCLRPWVDPVLKINLSDPADPTPYWLVSTRRPEDLMMALGKN